MVSKLEVHEKKHAGLEKEVVLRAKKAIWNDIRLFLADAWLVLVGVAVVVAIVFCAYTTLDKYAISDDDSSAEQVTILVTSILIILSIFFAVAVRCDAIEEEKEEER